MDKKICKLYIAGFSIRKIALKVKLNFEKVRQVILKNGLTRSQKKHSYKEDQFEVIDTEEKAYWLGFLYADADISLKKCRVKLALAAKDENHLKLFQKFMKTTSPISDYNYNKDESLKAKVIYINNKKITQDLISLGCVVKKSKVLEFPSMDSNLVRHFIRGYIDGDGWITIENSSRLRIGILGTKSFLDGVQNILKKHINFQPVKPIPKSNVFQISFGCNEINFKLWDFLYLNSSICLNRKREIMKNYLESKTDVY